MRTALIVDGVVDTISLCDPAPDGWVAVPDSVYAGFIHREGQFVDPTPTQPAVLGPLKPYQFHAALQINGINKLLTTAVARLKPRDRAIVEAKLQRMSEYHRYDPTVVSMLAAMGLTDEQADAMWTDALGI